MNIKQLLAGIVNWPAASLKSPLSPWGDMEITGLSSDSRLTQPGDLFFAHAADVAARKQHIAEAIEKGAVAVLRDADAEILPVLRLNPPDPGGSTPFCKGGDLGWSEAIPILCVEALRTKVGLIAARFYDEPTQHLCVIGITGTNGKTSCSQFIAASLEKMQRHCGVIGTLGTGFPNQMISGSLTTPDAITLQKTFSEFRTAEAKYVAMEVSSHSLEQRRTAGTHFDIGVFTNLTQDHLDYHGTMENYAQAKRLLFSEYPLKYAVINADDPFGQTLLAEFASNQQHSKTLLPSVGEDTQRACPRNGFDRGADEGENYNQQPPSKFPCYAYTMLDTKTNVPTISAHKIRLNAHGISAHIETPWGSGQIKTSLLGRFNLSNLLATIATLGIITNNDKAYSSDLKAPGIEEILAHVSSLTTVPGRMQTIGGKKLPLVVIDYAHTPDALEKALTSLREHTHSKLWCVFGCGGNRDSDKRHLMGEIAERYSDQIIITNDNPRFENPDKIIDDIMQGLLCPWAVEVEQDRQTAIAHAIDCAEAGDVILIAGKGHETYQEVMGEKMPFNDLEQAAAHLKLKKEDAKNKTEDADVFE